MLLLLSNDDGIDAPGLATLARHLAPMGDIVVVAPASEQSAASHALTMHEPLRVREHRPGWWAVSGTPADCVYLGVHHLCGSRPDLVVSGINRGANLGNDVHYSGTVAAAMEAALIDIPALAVSLYADWATPADRLHWNTAGEIALRVAREMSRDRLPSYVFLNLNVPDVEASDLEGVRPTSLGRRTYHPLVEVKQDPRGRNYYWIGGAHAAFEGDPDSDGAWIERGWATLCPLHPDLTDTGALDRVRRWNLA